MGSGGPSWLQSSGGSKPAGGGPSWLSQPAPGAAPPASKGGGGFLGALEGGAHWLASKAGLAAHDIKGIPGGLYDAAKVGLPVEAALMTGHLPAKKDVSKLVQTDKAIATSSEQSVLHPGRDPFQTAMTVLPLFTGGASAVARAGEAADAIRAGEGVSGAVKAAAAKPEMPPRLLNSGDDQVPLSHSKQPLYRAAQAIHDKIVQHSLDTKPEGKIAGYGQWRIGNALDEAARVQARMHEGSAAALDQAARRLTSKASRVVGRMNQAALELTSTNTTPEKAAAYHLEQAARQDARAAELQAKPTLTGKENAELRVLKESAPRNRVVAKLYQTVHDKGLLTTNDNGDVIVNAVDHPHLAEADMRLAKVQGRGDEILARYHIRTPEALQAAKDAPARYRAGGKYITPSDAQASASDVRQMGRAMEQVTAREGRASASAAAARARDLAKAADSAESRAFEAGTRRTQAEQEALAASARANRTAERASAVRFKHGPRAEEGERAARLLSRQQRITQIAYERFQRGEVGPGVVDRAQRRLSRLNDAYEKNASSVVKVRDASRAGTQAAAMQEGRLADLRAAEAAANKQFADLQTEAQRLRGRATGASYRADFLKRLGEARASSVRAMTERAVEEELARADKLIGGSEARPGRGYVSYASSEKRAPTSQAAASPGPVVGEARSPITSHTNKGLNIEHGVVPEDVTGAASRHFRQILRFVNTTERRNAAIRTGSDVRRSDRDVLVRVPGEEHAKIPQAVEEALGKSKPTSSEIHGLNAALDEYRRELVPGLNDNFAADLQHPVGTTAAQAAADRGLEAPNGYKWVDRHALGTLGRQPIGTGTGIGAKIGRGFDNVNTAVTAATVYFKVGHLGTRGLTNSATNIIQGSADPVSIGKSVELWKNLSDEDRARALAASGQHGIQALPHEGTGWIAQKASKGAGWWARRIDSPFRFNAIAYEARKAGFDTPEKFRDLLNKLENPHEHNMSAAERSKVMGVANRANREAIAYDRLSDFEKRYITRAFWFYPWTSAATRFAVNTALEHPLKAAVLANAGVHGRQVQQQQLGNVPSYENGLFKIGGPAGAPTVADFSTFSPLATSADVLGAAARPGEISGFLNTVYASLNALINARNQYGQTSTSPLKDAATAAVSPAPEAQILAAILGRNKPQGRKMFPSSPDWFGAKSQILRALLGPGLPRTVNRAALQSAYGRERTGR